ncbi:MAG: papain-like cysteine protease family protein, partial [Anaerolineales bacterium]
MSIWKRILAAAMVSIAALVLMTAVVYADCDEGEDGCPLIPPQSRQVVTSRHAGEDSSSADAYNRPVQPVPLTMPLPVNLDPVMLSPSVEEPQADFIQIEIPLRVQDPSDASCGVQALGMALDGLSIESPSSEAIFKFLSSNDYLYEFGTGAEELALAAQSFGYGGSAAFHGWTLEQLRAELDANRPIVVDLGANGLGQPGHFVTLTGIAGDWSQVAFIDPILGERVVSLAEFMHLWDLQGNSGVAVAASAPAVTSSNYSAWTALFAATMATLALGPSVLTNLRRRGVGGALVADSGIGGEMKHIGMEPPYAAPAGMKWNRGEAIYETHTRMELVYHEVEKKELQKVRIGTKTEKVPYTKRILVDNGHWETTYKSERYISGYRDKKILSYYKQERYVKYYRTRRYRTPYGFYSKRVPVYGYRSKPVYDTIQVPIYSYHQVPDDKRWVENWEWEEYTEYKRVEKPVYEEQWVVTGVEKIPEEKTIEEVMLVGHQWNLAQLPPEYSIPAPPPRVVWIEEGSRPNWIEPGIWYSLTLEEREAI